MSFLNIVLPSIDGDATKSGNALKCTGGAWPDGVVEKNWQWCRGDQPIEDATDQSYTLTADDDGSLMTCRVTAEDKDGRAMTVKAHPLLAEYGTPAPDQPVPDPMSEKPPAPKATTTQTPPPKAPATKR
jgi:hypothetical protein